MGRQVKEETRVSGNCVREMEMIVFSNRHFVSKGLQRHLRSQFGERISVRIASEKSRVPRRISTSVDVVVVDEEMNEPALTRLLARCRKGIVVLFHTSQDDVANAVNYLLRFPGGALNEDAPRPFFLCN